MQTRRSFHLVVCAAATGTFQHAIISTPWNSWLDRIWLVVATIFGLYFAVNFVGRLGGNLISTTVDGTGCPTGRLRNSWAPLVGLSLAIVLIVLAFVYPRALGTVDLLLGIWVGLRLIQWNGFEPDGFAAFNSAVR